MLADVGDLAFWLKQAGDVNPSSAVMAAVAKAAVHSRTTRPISAGLLPKPAVMRASAKARGLINLMPKSVFRNRIDIVA